MSQLAADRQQKIFGLIRGPRLTHFQLGLYVEWPDYVTIPNRERNWLTRKDLRAWVILSETGQLSFWA
jgi:hypothetical protein